MNKITSKRWSGSSSSSQNYSAFFLLSALLLIFVTSPAFAVDDDVPFFAGANGAPNIMFIFDNSDSMQDIPYMRSDGRVVRPGTNPNSANNTSRQDWKWRQGVQIGEDPSFVDDPDDPDDEADIVVMESGGNVLYDYAAFPSDIEQLIAKQTPLNLPGTIPASLSGTAETTISATTVAPQTISNLPGKTSLTSSISAFTDSDRIYDDSLDWTATELNASFDEFYLSRLVQVSSGTIGVADQFRTIVNVNSTEKYFELDTSIEGGGDLDYTNPPYTYTVLSEAPGRVTRNVGNSSILTDANIDWLDSSVGDSFIGRGITVTSGTNTGEIRKISGYDKASKTWTVSEPFLVACDETTRYLINQVDTNTDRVYDSSLDWSSPATALTDWTLFANNYRYRLIEVRSSKGTVQQRTITNRNTGGKYFTIDTSDSAGGPLVYSAAEVPYTYTILNNGPGNVTAVSGTNIVRDADIDWSIVSSEFYAKWKDRTLIITAGTNEGEERRITWASTGKYWQVDSSFPVACDLTTKYEILGTADDNRLAIGGNHPASKLYQAKKAVQLFLKDSSLQVCTSTDAAGNCTDTKYSVNMGFATYLAARVPRVTAKYVRTIAGYTKPATPTEYCARYTYPANSWGTFVSPDSDSSFTANGWQTAPVGSTSWASNRVFTGISVGSQIDRLWPNSSDCRAQTIRYTVYDIDHTPTDSLPNQYTFKLRSSTSNASEGGYWSYQTRCYEVSGCAAMPATDGSRTLISSGESCYNGCWEDPGDPAITYYEYLKPEYYDTYGDYSITNPTAAGYVDPVTHLVTPRSVSGRTLVSTTLTDVVINNSGGTGDIESNIYDSSYFMYPGEGDTDHPHGWSYKKAADPWIYREGESWNYTYFPKLDSNWNKAATYPWPGASGGWGTSVWGDAIQPDPYFPADVGDEMSNFTGDDQAIFVNLPPYDASDPLFGDDTTGLGIAKILEYTDLTRITSPRTDSSWARSHDFTIMPYSRSLAPNAYSATQGSGTPIAASLQDVKKYYEDYIVQDSMTQGKCRNNYVIFLTDGLETGGGDPVAAAQALLETTIDGIEYPIKTYVVGFGLNKTAKASLNAIAEAGGTGGAYFANNVEELVDILVTEITSSILAGSYSRASPVITKYDAGNPLRLYSAYFDYPSWKGHLKGYEVNPSSGALVGPAPGWLSECDDDTTTLDADAGCEMDRANYGRGTVFTSYLNSGALQRVEFDPANLTTVGYLKPLINPLGIDIDGDLSLDTDVDAQTIMNYTLDAGYLGGAYKGSRDVDWFLGDIYNSAPVVVSPPSFIPPDPPSVGADPYEGYTAFKSSYASRATRIFVGANDGMVHAFDPDNGIEDWAYIPNSVLGKINEFKEGHRFTVDLPLRASDIYSAGGSDTIWSSVAPGNEESGWHTILTSGLRGGGYSYFSIDVTDPTNPAPMWEVSDVDADVTTRDMGKTWSAPSIGRIMIDGVNTSVLFVGGGLSANANTGNNLYIIEAGSGIILKEFDIGSSTNNVPSEMLLIADLDVNSDMYGNIVKGYFGDTEGDLWKISNLNDEAGGSAWNPAVTMLHDGDGKVFHKPAISDVAGNCLVEVDGYIYTINSDTTFVMYGTGDEEAPTDLTSTDHVYQIADPPLTPVPGNPNPSLTRVWERDLDAAEKLLTDPFVYLDTAYFITYTPKGGCAQGTSYLWGLTMTRCGHAGGEPGLIYNLAGDNSGGPWDRLELGAGITSSPTLGGPVMYVQTAGGVPPTVIQLPDANRLEYWRENL